MDLQATTISPSAQQSGGLPALWVVAPQFGAVSEVWIWRQVRAMTRVKPRVVCARYLNREQFPVPGIAVDEALLNGPDPDAGWGRWPRRLRNLPGRNFFGATGAELRGLLRLAREHPPDVLLGHFGFTALRLLPLARMLNVPIVAHFHGMDLSSNLRNRWYRWSLGSAIREFDALVIVGDRHRQVVRDLGADMNRVHQIPCGVPADEFTPPLQRGSEKLRILVVARLVEVKGVEYAIRAFHIARSQLPESELHIIGDGPLMGPLHQLATDLGVGAHVTFHGSLPNSEVRSWLGRCDIFLQHSITGSDGACEGSPVAVVEASASGLPVVGSRSGGICDQVVHGETGLLVEERDVAGTASAIVTLGLDPALRTRMGLAGRQQVLDHFDSRQQVRRLEDLLQSLIRGRVVAGGEDVTVPVSSEEVAAHG